MTELPRYLSLSSPLSSRSIAVLCAAAVSACAADSGTPSAAASPGTKHVAASLRDALTSSRAPAARHVSGFAGEYDQAAAESVYDSTAQSVEDVAATAAAVPSGYTQYYVLGDSYVAGTGNPDSSTDKCHTSSTAWPYGVASDLGLPTPYSVACSGAVIADINKQYTFTNTDQNTLILVGIGGNNVLSEEQLVACAISDCYGTIAPVITSTVAQALTNTFQTLRNQAPQATIIAVGYPHMIADGVASCNGVDAATAATVNSLIDLMNATIAATACAVGVDSITTDIVNAFAGHEGCAPSGEYINSSVKTIGREWEFAHPNAFGNDAYRVGIFNGFYALASAATRCSSVPAQQPAPVQEPVPAAAPVPVAIAATDTDPEAAQAATPEEAGQAQADEAAPEQEAPDEDGQAIDYYN